MAGLRSKESPWYKIMIYGLEFIGLYYGSYRAFVYDNNDPEKMNRLQLIVPGLNSTAPLDIWAYPLGLWGAKNYGMQLLPQVGDMVFVEFENGNADYPIWKHAGYAKEELPLEFKTPNHYGFKTPQGSIILINDNKGEEEILVKHSNGKEYFDLTKEKLELEAKLIKLGKNGDEWAVLGETLKAKLETLMDRLDDTEQAIITHTHTTPVGPSGPPIQAPTFISIKAQLISLKAEFIQFLSKKVKIDK